MDLTCYTRSMWEKLKKMLGFGSKKPEKKVKKETDWTQGLPKGVMVKQIEISGEKLLRWLLYVGIAVYFLWAGRKMLANTVEEQVPFSQLVEIIKNSQAEIVRVSEGQISVKLRDKNEIKTAFKEPNMSMVEYLQKEGIDVSKVSISMDNTDVWKMIESLFTIFGTVFTVLFLVWMFKKGAGAGGMGGAFGFGKSPAKLFIKGKQKITFADVAGVDEAKKDLEEIVDFLKNPTKYQKMGARVPKGVLLVGSSGVGKTLLAKAVAGEANVPFFSMAGSEFMEMLVGVGASRVRDLFATAKRAGKAIIFIDEIDAIGRVRGGLEGGHGEREQTLNQILVEMDGFEPNQSVVVLAATNRGDLLDPALKRPGRFDRTVVLELPDLEAREAILKIHAKGKPFETNIDWTEIAKRTVSFSGADLENMLNEAAIAAARANRTKISKLDLDEAAMKVKMGPAKKRSQTEEDKLMTAYHEAGHAIVNYLLKLDPVHKITIVSRGMALGFTFTPPERDRIHETRARLEGQMAMAMGGRAAEILVFKDVTTGASSDIEQATRIARAMVTSWGMSKLGPINMNPQMDTSNRMWMEPIKISEAKQYEVDTQVQILVETAAQKALDLLTKNMTKLDQMAKRLVEVETIDREEFEKMMKD